MTLANDHFWSQLEKPIIGLSPMDGVTDPCFRRVMAIHARPDIIMTEFLSVEGICHGARNALMGLSYHTVERPVIAQLYGPNPETFFHVAQLVCELGYDGLDVNMGCPSKKVAALGSGAALIKDPPRAKAIVEACRKGIAHWASGAPLSICETYPLVGDWLGQVRGDFPKIAVADRRPIPVSVKTRIGVGEIVIEDWVKHLLEVEPAAISIHGRTLKQGYRGDANWEMIAKAVACAEGSSTLILGNGDIKSMPEALSRVQETGVDGILIGRAAVGNPWVFHKKELMRGLLKSSEGISEVQLARIANKNISAHERFFVALQHARLYEAMHGGQFFNGMRKHLGSYCRDFSGARILRSNLVRSSSVPEVEVLIKAYCLENQSASKRPKLSRSETQLAS